MTLLDLGFRRSNVSEKLTTKRPTVAFHKTQEVTTSINSTYNTIDVELDQSEPIFWCWMHPLGKPIVTSELLTELKAMHRSLPSILDRANKPVKYYVFASRTRGTYSLGGDLTFFSESVRTGNRAALHAYAHHCIDVVWQHVISFNRPLVTVALIQGDALGGGFETALSCDVIIAEKSAKMGLPEVLFNLFPGMGAYSFLTRRVGPSEAHRLVTSGTIYTAEQLYAMGIVDVLVEDGEGVYGVRDYVKNNRSRFNAQRASCLARKRVHPVTEAELRDIVDIWVDAVFQLTELHSSSGARRRRIISRRCVFPICSQGRPRYSTDAWDISVRGGV
jgi:DSF synthase